MNATTDLKTLKNLKVKDKRVLMRADFNVPLKDGVITDDSRVRAALPTIQKLLDEGATLILMSHLGRPKGAEDKYRLEPVAKRLSELLGREVRYFKAQGPATSTNGHFCSGSARGQRDAPRKPPLRLARD